MVPRIYWERSSRRVLTMDYLDGIKITNVEELRALGVDTAATAEALIDIYNVMILRHGMFHADPHPGNLFVLPPHDGEPARIGLVDFGLTKRLAGRVPAAGDCADQRHHRPASRRGFDRDGGHGLRTRVHDEETYYELGEAFLGDVLRSGRAYADQQLFADVNLRLGRVLRANPLVEVPGDVVLIARVMGLLSGIGRSLDSETDLMDAILPYLEEESAAGSPAPTP